MLKYRYALFEVSEAAKQNQKFPFHFLSAPPTPSAENLKERKENFWFLLPRPKGADEVRIICFGNRFGFGTINTPKWNSTG
ncbi:MAG: hypothetical protein A2644_02415 [Candidatus Zambryskibacteria bacterium RIFCSPHIGHO2_01_FULL_39_63]|nr:MAG: hypothetical protein A2644_02415 [Candidatus Zambryskibacteria bacterium RIFCSPHIGHO2_01_FULL_39_63]